MLPDEIDAGQQRRKVDMTILDTIVARKKEEIAQARAARSEQELERGLESAPPARDFRGALEAGSDVQIIAEIKKASPSAGIIRADFDPEAIAGIYQTHGAACLSVLTDEPFFQGHLEYLRRVRQVVALPVLRKDFILERYQLVEARLGGADAVLLIAEILDDPQLKGLQREATALGMQSLVELHDKENLPRVLDSGARLVGINNRDLRTFATRLEHTLKLAERVPADVCLVSESGIGSRADVERLRAGGIKAVLVGETLMRSRDIGTKLDELRGRHGGG
jgi:indole-3-glycerol phosphate synthase